MNDGQREKIHRLWDELADFEVGRSDEALTRLMTVLGGMVGAQNVGWNGAVRMMDEKRDPLKGWRVPVNRMLRPHPAPNVDLIKKLQHAWNSRKMDESFLIGVRDPGRFRWWSFRRMMPPKWFKSEFFKCYHAPLGIYDAVFISFPLNLGAESVFGFDRVRPRRAFSKMEIEMLCYALRGIKWFHRQIMLSHGLLASKSPVTPSERKVLHLLLTEASEKEMAAGLGVSVNTAHEHVTSIFRKFGVSGRSGLMSLWLGGGR